MVRIISFDVGIKNMAYCVMECVDKVSIVDWGVLNLMPDTQDKPKCTCKKRNGEICGKSAKYEKQNDYYCETHAKSQTNWLIPTAKYKSSVFKKLGLNELNEQAHTHGIGPFKTKKVAIDSLQTYYTTYVLDVWKKENASAKTMDLVTIGKNMRKKLDELEGLKQGIDSVVIENQISPIANRMKTVQGMLAQYFIMRFENLSIDFVSSLHKLKQFSGNKEKQEKQEEPSSINATYKEHKRDGVYYTEQILKENDCFARACSLFTGTKRDDLADCFLQGLWYLTSKKIIRIAENLKINNHS